MKRILILFIFLQLNFCGIDGPDVIIDREANEKISRVIYQRLISVSGNQQWYVDFFFLISRPSGSSANTDYYFTRDVDLCIRGIQYTPAISFLFASILFGDNQSFIKKFCKITPVKFTNPTHPFQGEIIE